MSKNLNISVLVAARDEYIEQLKSIMAPLIYQGVYSIYQDSIKLAEERKLILWTFQKFLKDILTWNQTILQEESKRIKKKCSYIMDIVTAIFVSNVKILSSIRLNGNKDNIKVKIPTCELFVHSIYIEAAQQIFYNPYLFHCKNQDYSTIQSNKKHVNDIIHIAVDETIRKMMPFDDILQEYLKNALDDNAEYTDSESEGDHAEELNNEFGNLLDNNKVIESESEPETEEPKNFNIDVPKSYFDEMNPPVPPVQPPPAMGGQSPGPQFDPNGYDSGSDSGSSYSSGSSGSSRSSSSSSSSGSSGSSQASRKHHRHQERGHRGSDRDRKKHSFF